MRFSLKNCRRHSACTVKLTEVNKNAAAHASSWHPTGYMSHSLPFSLVHLFTFQVPNIKRCSLAVDGVNKIRIGQDTAKLNKKGEL